MIDDPIVKEIHETRRRILEECNGDLEQLIAPLKAAEAKDKDRLVTMDEANTAAVGSRKASRPSPVVAVASCVVRLQPS